MNNEEHRLSEQLSYLHLPFIQENHHPLAAQAAREQWTHEQYLARLIEGESLRRQDRCIARRIAGARFPLIKSNSLAGSPRHGGFFGFFSVQLCLLGCGFVSGALRYSAA